MSILLIATCAALWFSLHRKRYFESFPLFRWNVAAMIVYTAVNATLPVTSHWNRWIWTPTEVLYLATLMLATAESMWVAYDLHLPAWSRATVISGILVMAGGICASMLNAPTAIPAIADWYWQLIATRAWLLVALSIWMLVSGAIALRLDSGRPHCWPRMARAHMLLLFMVSLRSLFGGMMDWRYNHAAFQWLWVLCCLGWMINSDLLRRERGLAAKLLIEFPAPDAKSRGGTPGFLLPSARSAPPASAGPQFPRWMA